MKQTLKYFDADLVTIERKRFSTTQGEVLVTYAGQSLGQFGDDIRMVTVGPRRGEYDGHSTPYWHRVARSQAIGQGLALDPDLIDATPETIDATPTWSGVMPALIAVLQGGSPEGHKMAFDALMGLARDVDALNDLNRTGRA